MAGTANGESSARRQAPCARQPRARHRRSQDGAARAVNMNAATGQFPPTIMCRGRPSACQKRTRIDTLPRRLRDPCRRASLHTLHTGWLWSGRTMQPMRGTPVETPLPRKSTSKLPGGPPAPRWCCGRAPASAAIALPPPRHARHGRTVAPSHDASAHHASTKARAATVRGMQARTRARPGETSFKPLGNSCESA